MKQNTLKCVWILYKRTSFQKHTKTGYSKLLVWISVNILIKSVFYEQHVPHTCHGLTDRRLLQVWPSHPDRIWPVLAFSSQVHQIQNNSACPQSFSPIVSYLHSRPDLPLFNVKNAAVIFNTSSESVFAVMLTPIALEHLLFLPPNSRTNYPIISTLVIIKFKNFLNIRLTFLKVLFSLCKFYWALIFYLNLVKSFTYQTCWYGPYMAQVWEWYGVIYGTAMGHAWNKYGTWLAIWQWKKTLQGRLINLPAPHSYDQSRIECLRSDFNINYLRKLLEIIGVCSFFFWKGVELTNTLIYLHPNLVAGIMQVLFTVFSFLLYKLECFLGNFHLWEKLCSLVK